MQNKYSSKRHAERVQLMTRKVWLNDNRKLMVALAFVGALWLLSSSVDFYIYNLAK